jgi:cytosine/uracil/thiamine/allantoin permease
VRYHAGAVETTPASADFVELTEDISGSPLWNADLAPTPLTRRTW